MERAENSEELVRDLPLGPVPKLDGTTDIKLFIL